MALISIKVSLSGVPHTSFKTFTQFMMKHVLFMTSSRYYKFNQRKEYRDIFSYKAAIFFCKCRSKNVTLDDF